MLKTITYFFVIILFLSACGNKAKQLEKWPISSPNGEIQANFWIENGKPYYEISFKNRPILVKSALGFVLSDNDTLSNNLILVNHSDSAIDETWEQPWGQQKFVRNYCNEATFNLTEASGSKRSFAITFRVFNDGVGFRYSFPNQTNLTTFTIMDELTSFNFHDVAQAWWIPAYKDNRYEYLFKKSPINELDTVHTPLTLELPNGVFASIHEAALVNYASMTLASDKKNGLKCDLTPWSNGTKVNVTSPFNTPWRTIILGHNAGELITSTLMLNLNEPCKLEDLSYIKPHKYLGIWWGMHIGKYSFWEGPIHGATTARSKEYIDYCNKLGIDHLLIEGWNKGWTPQWYENKMHVFSFTESTSDFNFKEVANYAKAKGVSLIGYHETGSNIENYLPQIDAGMKMYQDGGLHAIKIGQVGSRLNMKEWHHGQFGVNYYQYVLEKAAQYKLAVNFHEPIKPTGLCRTYPNLLAGEGGRGMEYDAWSEGNPPEHTVIIPFTRLLAGSMDFTPGIFAIKGTRVHTTLAKQLALYLTIYSPIQMLADLPENYVGNPAFKFLQDVPVNWDTTVVLNAQIGDFLTIVRKDINSNDWYLGSITNQEQREFDLPLTFLSNGKSYSAEIYADGKDACFDSNPESVQISKMEVTNKTILKIKLAKGGGQAIRFIAEN